MHLYTATVTAKCSIPSQFNRTFLLSFHCLLLNGDLQAFLVLGCGSFEPAALGAGRGSLEFPSFGLRLVFGVCVGEHFGDGLRMSLWLDPDFWIFLPELRGDCG